MRYAMTVVAMLAIAGTVYADGEKNHIYTAIVCTRAIDAKNGDLILQLMKKNEQLGSKNASWTVRVPLASVDVIDMETSVVGDMAMMTGVREGEGRAIKATILVRTWVDAENWTTYLAAKKEYAGATLEETGLFPQILNHAKIDSGGIARFEDPKVQYMTSDENPGKRRVIERQLPPSAYEAQIRTDGELVTTVDFWKCADGSVRAIVKLPFQKRDQLFQLRNKTRDRSHDRPLKVR